MYMALKKTTKRVAKTAKSVGRSDEAKAFMQMMADYEAVNPEKFALKKDRLKAKLATL